MSVLGQAVYRSRKTLAWAVAAGVASGAAGVGMIALVQAELARPGPSSWRMGAAFAALCVVGAVARVAAHVATIRAGQGAIASLCVRICRQTLAMPLERFEKLDSSALLAVLTEDVVLVAQAMAGLPQVCIDVPIVAGCLLYIGWLSPPVLLGGLIFAALAVSAYLAMAGRALARIRAARSRQDQLVGHFRTLIHGFRELKQHGPRRRAFLSELLEPTAQGVREGTARGLGLYAIVLSWGQLAFFSFLGVVAFALPAWVGLERPAASGIVLVLLFLLGPLDWLISWLPVLGSARASMGRISALMPQLEGADEASDAAAEIRPLPFRGEIELDGIAYHYEGRDPGDDGFRLGPIDLTLRAGELVILAGGNGSGKTTLLKLLTGLYEPNGGAIRIDGRELGDGDREAYRQLFTAVFNDGHLFRDLIGLDAADLESRASSSLERMDLGGRVGVTERAFSTVELSQGQRGRLALISALLEDRPVYVLDEWAANQDARFKRFFYHEVLPELRAAGKAVLVISHDETYYDLADRVVRLREGRVEGWESLVAEGHD
ncbi:MAG: cyclic peptide export ABC transporter [Isosphaeraceae bacterium]